jgi:hypothetical protein
MNKGDIEAKLRDREFSCRGAVYVLNFVLDEVAVALKRVEPVEFPFGSLRNVGDLRKKQRVWFLYKITTIYKKPYTVVHAVSAAGGKLLQGKKSKAAPTRPRRACPCF